MTVYQLKIALNNEQVFRTIKIDGEDTFCDFAEHILTCFSLSSIDLWMFQIDKNFILIDIDEDEDSQELSKNTRVENAFDFILIDLIETYKTSIVFSCESEDIESDKTIKLDFSIELEAIFDEQESDDVLYPICVNAEGNHPDVDFIDVSKLSKKELMFHNARLFLDIKEINEWLLGDNYDNDEFEKNQFDGNRTDGFANDELNFTYNYLLDTNKKDKNGGFIIPFSLN